MDDKKIELIFYNANGKFATDFLEAAQNVSVPAGYSLKVSPVSGEEKYFAYNSAMKNSDAKYKIYLDENSIITEKNFLNDVLKIFESDKNIGMIGCSGAIQLSTHGICFSSAQRCGKVQIGTNKNIKDWGTIDGDYCEVEVVDDFFIATQYDIPFKEEFENFGATAQCVEFKRAGYKNVVIRQAEPFIWYRINNISLNEKSRRKFLEEYSKDIFPLVSIIIPTFNRPKFFQEALESVLNQTYRNFEIIISDDSTNDETEKLIQPYLKKYSCIKYFRNKGFTANDNWNFLRKYNNPNAEYVNWLLDDDLFYPAKLERMVEVYRNNPDVSLVTSSKNFINANSQVTGSNKNFAKGNMKINGEEAGRLLFSLDNYIGEPSIVLIRKKFLRDNDLCWNEDETGFFGLVDVSTWCQLLTQGNLFYISDVLSGFRTHSGQASYWQYTSALFAVSYIKLFKTALDKKVFFHTEEQKRSANLFLLNYAVSTLRKAHNQKYFSEEIKSLDKYLEALSHSLNNNYEFELPEVKYSMQDENNKIN